MPGARRTPGIAVGRRLLPSREEWTVRNRVLAATLAELIVDYAPHVTARALDVGCQWGMLLDLLSHHVERRWWGADPLIARHMSQGGNNLVNGWADDLPFPDSVFDCVVLANVYEHIPPGRRDSSLKEIWRVLTPSGVLVGQLPNPHFPIESHSRLPFMGWLPPRAQDWYWNVSPARRGAGFYSVTIGDLKRRARAAGFEFVLVRNFNYPVEAAPESVRRILRLARAPLAVVPWSWQFVLRRPSAEP